MHSNPGSGRISDFAASSCFREVSQQIISLKVKYPQSKKQIDKGIFVSAQVHSVLFLIL
jgi:hypothetical protein